MASGAFVAYYRVSTQKQGRSGLGLEGQRQAVEAFLNGGDWRLVGEFTEVEAGTKSDRAQLQAALQACRVFGARLIIAKLDRLSRDPHFLSGLRRSGVDFLCADMPFADPLTIGVLGLVAEREREMISARTKAALEAAKKRGVKLGGFRAKATVTDDARRRARAVVTDRADQFAEDAATMILRIRDEMPGASLGAIAAELTARGVPTPRCAADMAKAKKHDVPAPRRAWQPVQVKRVLERAGR